MSYVYDERVRVFEVVVCEMRRQDDDNTISQFITYELHLVN